MKCRTIVAASIAMLFSATIASANVVDLTGMYGNKAGCNYLYNAERDDDSLIALTSQAYERFATGCEFVQASKAMDGSQVATMLCSHEGEMFRSIEFMLIMKAGERDAYELYSESGEQIAVVDRCE